jgi:hypothetical protein
LHWPANSEVARHARSYDRGKVIEVPAHIAELAREKRRAHDLRGRDLLRSACKHADALLDALALRGENLGGHTTRLTQLLDRYGAAELDRAIADALSRGAPGAASVAHILDQQARARKALPVQGAVAPPPTTRNQSHGEAPYHQQQPEDPERGGFVLDAYSTT